MKTKKMILIVCCILLSAFVLGAAGVIKVSSDAAGEGPESDRLIGVLITDEYLDLFDSDRFFSDNIHRLADGKEISESESAKYQGRLYASLNETKLTNEETGETVTGKEYVFNGIHGIRFFAPYITDASGSSWSTDIDEGITDGNSHLQITDEGESISLKGTIFVASRGKSGHFYFNPVYQTSKGDVYTVGGDGVLIQDEGVPGECWSKTISENREVSSDDANQSSGTEVEVTVCVMSEPTNIALLQFNGKNELLARTEYRPGTLPERLDVLADTQYLIMETSSSEGLTRTLFQSEDDYAYAFYCRSDGICIKQESEIEWNPNGM